MLLMNLCNYGGVRTRHICSINEDGSKRVCWVSYTQAVSSYGQEGLVQSQQNLRHRYMFMFPAKISPVTVLQASTLIISRSTNLSVTMLSTLKGHLQHALVIIFFARISRLVLEHTGGPPTAWRRGKLVLSR